MRKNIQNILIGGAAGLLAFLGSEVSQEIWKPFFDEMLPAISRSWLWILLTLSVLVNLVLLYLVFDFLRSDPKADYEIVDERGFYRRKNTPSPYYCGGCFAESIFSPLTPRFIKNMKRPDTPTWLCPRKSCGQVYQRKEGEGVEFNSVDSSK